MTEEVAAAGLIYGFSPHYIDHLAPLCDLLDIPLIVTEKEIKLSIQEFYPTLKVIFLDYVKAPEAIVREFNLLFVCTPKALFDEVFFLMQCLLRKKVHTVWCPHGNSDKGHASACMEALDKEELSLVYGEKMIDFLKQKNAFSGLKSYIKTGNYRKAYYEKNKEFYDKKLKSQVLDNLPSGKKNILYAPTWEDTEKSSSFVQALPHLVKNLPEEFNLIVKPHPNLLVDPKGKSMSLIKEYEKHKGVFFLKDFPPIYPLLAKTDLYIGDMSSIGYDFLSFKRPMFFLNEQKRDSSLGLYLYRCGIEVLPKDYDKLYTLIQGNPFTSIQEEVYEYTFGKDAPLGALKEQIETLYRHATI